MKILVTGGAGFIGSALIRHLMAKTDIHVVNLDKLTYAAVPEALAPCQAHDRYEFVAGDIADRALVGRLLDTHDPDGIINLAAESHVDRSIRAPAQFIQTNIVGTSVLLDAARVHRDGLSGTRRDRFRFHHVSTDEVFGSLSDADPPFSEASPYAPRSPYAASKAAADHLVRAWHETYGLPTIVTHGSNTYGPWQYPEKLIPVTAIAALDGRQIPVYGAGDNVRDWISVADHAEAIAQVFARGRTGETYAIGGGRELRNIDLVKMICGVLDDIRPRAGGRSYADQIAFVDDRPGHDHRYALATGKIERDLDWRPTTDLNAGVAATVRWYVEHEAWWRAVLGRTHTDPRG